MTDRTLPLTFLHYWFLSLSLYVKWHCCCLIRLVGVYLLEGISRGLSSLWLVYYHTLLNCRIEKMGSVFNFFITFDYLLHLRFLNSSNLHASVLAEEGVSSNFRALLHPGICHTDGKEFQESHAGCNCQSGVLEFLAILERGLTCMPVKV